MAFSYRSLLRRRRDRLDADVLAAVRAGEPFGWELSRNLQVSPSRVHASLTRLQEAGAIRVEPFQEHVDVPARPAYYPAEHGDGQPQPA